MAQAQIHAARQGSQISYVIEAGELADIEEAIARIERNYHPLGYGTSFQPPTQKPDGSWIAYGSRANSCD